MADEEEPEVHPLVELLLKRMESNPEEFDGTNIHGGRWGPQLGKLAWFMTDKEKKLLLGKIREHIFDTVYQEVLKELLDPEGANSAKTIAWGSPPIRITLGEPEKIGGWTRV